MALNSVFSIAKSSLFAHQQALAVTSANLANVNNPYYSRQVAMFGTLGPDTRAPYSFGTGVAVEKIVRIRNSVTDVQIRVNNSQYYDADKRASVLKQIETLFSEPSEYGLSNLMSSFFNSWDELALDPSSLSLRTDVVQNAQMLSEKIDNIYSGISNSKSDAREESNDIVSSINTTLEQLHNVNKQIYEASVVGNNANDLIDTRDMLLEDLSKYVNMNVSIDENNVANVSIGGIFAVDGLHYKQFKIERDDDQIRLVTEGDEIRATITGGSLSSLLDLHNNDLPSQMAKLEELANALMENVNNVHSQGFSITEPSITGINFFSDFKAGKLEINEQILDDPSMIAISEDGTSGNNSIALRIAELKDANLLNGKTLSENYSEYISGVANEINLQEQNAESYALVLNQLEQTKMQYSGVSTDEEMVNVMKFQRSYDAAAKLITVADELMQTLLTLV